MFSLYVGGKNKLIDLSNTYIVDATFQDKINEPLSLEITFDLVELRRTGNQTLIDYLLSYETEMYLEIKGLNFGYLFTKKHNQNAGVVLIGQQGGNYVTVQGNEQLPPNSDFFMANGGIATTNGASIIIARQSIIDPNVQNRIEYQLYNDVESSQNMVNRLKIEEVSIAGQVLQDNLLTLSLFSTLSLVDYSYTTIVYGREYDMDLEQFIKQLLPVYDVVIDSSYNIKYKVENKLPLEILNDVLGSSKVYRCGGYNFNTGRKIIEIYDSRKKVPSVRCVNTQYQNTNPYVINIKENFPTLSASIELNNQFIRAGEKVIFDWSNEITRYSGQFMFDGVKINLLEVFKDGNTNVTLQKTNLDVRRNTLDSNIIYLSQKSYE